VVDLWLEDAQLPNGVRVELEVVRHAGAAAVVALDRRQNVTLVYQYRHAAGGYIWEVPAGKLDGDSPEHCARRELQEEAGLRADRWIRLGCILTTPGFSDERIHLFLAQELSEGTQQLESDEVLRVVQLPLQEALAMIQRGEIADAKSIAALHLASSYLRQSAGS
jgi:ADP-ribose pyrophosphatase